jgi:phosphatidylinositol kinase/protein kinase (PI-3  family)
MKNSSSIVRLSENLLCHFITLLQSYGRDLAEAQDWCRKYQNSRNVKDLTQAWDLYYHVFRRITKQLPQVLYEKQHGYIL